MIKEVFKQLWKDKFARIALIVLGLIYLALFFADFIAPYTKDFSDRTMAYVPPSKIFVIDENGKLSKPYTYNYRRHLITTDPDGRLFLLGTDINGRDVFSRLLFGGRISMTIGFLALFVLFPIGLLYGGISGYFGGKVDSVMMRFAEAVMSIPSFYLLIILASVLPSGMTSIQRFKSGIRSGSAFNRAVKARNYRKTHSASDNKLCNCCDDAFGAVIYSVGIGFEFSWAWNSAA